MVRMGALEATPCGSVLAVGLEVRGGGPIPFLPPSNHDPILRTLWAPGSRCISAASSCFPGNMGSSGPT